MSKRNRKLNEGTQLTDFGEGDQLAAGLASLFDEVDRLLNTTFEVEPLKRSA
jgi:hypothetical protein